LETAPQSLPFRLELSFMTVGKRHAASMFKKEPYNFDELDHFCLGEQVILAEKAGARRVSDSGEGRWTINAAIDEDVPAQVLTAALYERFSSRGEADFANKLVSAMRYEFGGHLEKATTKGDAA